MEPTPIDKIKFNWNDHKSTLWWLCLLYRRPKDTMYILKNYPRRNQITAAFKLYMHSIIYILIFVILSRLIIFEMFDIPKNSLINSVSELANFHARNILNAIALANILGILMGIILGIFWGIASVIVLTFILGIFLGMGFGLVNWIIFCIFVLILVLRLYYFPFHLFFILPKIQGNWYPYHPIAWDNFCLFPFPAFSRLLVSYWEFHPQAGTKEIKRLIDHYPSQRNQALRAKTIIIAREAAQNNKLILLDYFAAQLPEGEKGFLVQISQIRQMLHEICRLQTRLETISRPILREPYARMVKEQIDIFKHRIIGFYEPISSEFYKAADYWLKIAEQQLLQVKAILAKEPILQIFRAGDPVDRNQEAFVPRFSVIGDIEQQVMLRTGCPGIVLYGRRRTGKTTIIKNLEGFLPGSVITIFISMQDPEAFSSLSGFNHHLVSKLKTAFSPAQFEPSHNTTLADLLHILTTLNANMQQKNQRLLLTIDEYENIDVKIGEKIFPIDFMATIRESIQNHRGLTWIFVGSHEIAELKHVQWASYLLSAQTIEIPLFKPEETRLLLTEPMKHSALWEKDSPQRPRFDPSFWGENGIERVHHEAGGWPHLVQLIAETIVDLINDEDKRQVDEDLFNRALNKAIVSGHNVMYQLMRGESTLPGEWEYLSAFRKRETQLPPDDENIYRSLWRRLLIAEEGGEWRLRVPLMERWLKERG